MSVFMTLAKEHRLFEKLVGTIEAAASYAEPIARLELKRSLLVLLPALERHEEFEDIVLEDPAYLSIEGAGTILGLVRAQHRKIQGLRRIILDLLEEQDVFDISRLKSSALILCSKLRAHFQAEESLLWPHYNQAMSHSMAHKLNQRAALRVSRLEKEIRDISEQTADYVKSKN